MEKILTAVKAKHEARQLKGNMALTTSGGHSKITEVTGPDKNARALKDKSAASKDSAQSAQVESKGKTKSKPSKSDGTVSQLDVSACVTKAAAAAQLGVDESKTKKQIKAGEVDFDKAAGNVKNTQNFYSHLEDYTQ